MTLRPRSTHHAVRQDGAGEERSRVLSLYALGRQYGQSVDRVEGWIMRAASLAAATQEMEREMIRPPIAGQPTAIDAADVTAMWSVLLFGRPPQSRDGMAARLMDEGERRRPQRFTEWLLGAGPGSHPVQLWSDLLRSLPGMASSIELAGGVGASPRATLARALRDAAMAEIDLMISASPAWRRICRIVQVPNYRPHRVYLKSGQIAPIEAGEGGTPYTPPGADWPNTIADPQIRDRFVDVVLSVERFLSAPAEIGAEILAGQQRWIEQLTAEITAVLVTAATAIAGKPPYEVISNANAALAAEMLGGRRISATGARPIVVVSPDEIEAFRSIAPSAVGDESASAATVIVIPSAAIGTRLAVSAEFAPAIVTAFNETPEQPQIAIELPAAQQPPEMVEGVERPVYVPSRSPRLSMLWSRSAPTTWPGAAGVRKMTITP